MDDCDFCQIAAGDRDAHVLYESDRTIAMLDRNPANQGHTLVIPTAHHRHLFSADESVSRTVFRTVRTVARAINDTLEPQGISLFYTTADLVGTVTHAHVHLVPRYVDDDIQLALAREPLDDDRAAHLAARVREQM